MRRLVATKALSKTEWLKVRKQGITGTDAAAIAGMHPFLSAFQVYMDKITEDVSELDNEAMRQGRDFEEYVAQRFTEETGLKVRRANAIFQSEVHPLLLADFDRIVVGEKAGLECKTVSPYSAEKWADGMVPIEYQLQVQHYLAVSGYDHWYIAALIFGKDFVIRRINRDEETIQALIQIEESFWHNHIEARTMPQPDGSDGYSSMLSKIYAKGDPGKTVDLSSCDTLLRQREELNEMIEKMETEKERLDQEIKLEMGDAAYGSTAHYKVSWASYEQNRLDTKLLKQEQPEVYRQYLKQSSGRRFQVKKLA